MELNICHLYPDILNLYGDRGNILCMQKRLEWRGIGVTVTGVSIGQALETSAYDLLFVGGGQDFEQEVLLGDLAGAKTKELKSAIEDGLPVLAICGGYQMLGQYYKTWDGVQCDYMFTCDELNYEIVGFENHSGKTYLGAGVKPMGKVLAGFGNNGEDGTEGARYKNVFGTYSHGSLLPKNPKLADHILRVALERKYGEAELTPLDDSLETAAHDYMKRRLEK